MTIDANIRNDATGPESYRLGLDAALKEAIQAFVDVRFVPENDAFEDAVFGSAAVDDAAESESYRGYSAPTFARNMLSVQEPRAAGTSFEAPDAPPVADMPLYGAASAPSEAPAPVSKRRARRDSVLGTFGKTVGGLARRGKHAKAPAEEHVVELKRERAEEPAPEFEVESAYGHADESLFEYAEGRFATADATHKASLREWLDEVDAPFSTTLLRLIDERGYDDVEVYKRAGMSRQLFSRIRSDAEYRPAKKTVLALAVALRLNAEEARDLLERAGFALSHSDKRDLVVEYFLENGKHDLMAVNQALYEFDQPLL